LRWGEALGAHVEGREVFERSAGRERFRETGIGPPQRRKALERESQERWGLKEALEGW
jgi:hypothetical protein